MLFHAVLFNFKEAVEGEKREEILKITREKLGKIPGVKNLLVGKTIKHKSEFEYGLFMHLENQDALQTYREHPDHVYFRDVEFFPFLENYKGLDYED